MRRVMLVIIAKAPVAGHVKTRLACTIGYGRAAALFSTLTEITLARAFEAQRRLPNLDIVLAVDQHDGLAARYRCWDRSLTRIVQGPGNLGDRMLKILHDNPATPVLFIGADAPDLTVGDLTEAALQLRHADCVIGPADDGGYWLIGVRQNRSAPDLFKDVRWSSAATLGDTMRTLPTSFSVYRLRTMNDIDDSKDLQEALARGVLRSGRLWSQRA